MRTAIFLLKDFTYPYLKELLVDLVVNGIQIISCIPDDISEELRSLTLSDTKNDAYIITDCEKGVRLALNNDIGFVFYEGDEPANISTLSAECIIQGFEEITTDFLVKMYERHNHIPWTILSTDRLLLREITVSDVDRLYEIYSEPSITEYTENLFDDKQEEIEYTKDYIKNVYEFAGYGMWLVIEKATGLIIGRAGLSNREGFDDAELGYIIEKDKQRMGYAYEICQGIINYAKNELLMNSINCFIKPGNVASKGLVNKLGFKLEETVMDKGIILDRYVYRLHE